MTTVLSPSPKQQFFDNAGRPLVNGKLFTYQAGTSTKTPTYVDSAGVTQNSNPINLDFRGECDLWLQPNTGYKFVLSPSTDTDPPTNPIWTVDQIFDSQLITLYGGVDTGSANAYVLNFTANFTAYTDGIVIYWIPSNNNTGASTLNVNGLGPIPIKNQNGSDLYVNQLVANQMVAVAYKGGVFLLLQFNPVPTINTVNANYVFTLSDAQNIVRHTDAVVRNYTVPLDSTANFAIGTSIQVINESSVRLNIISAIGVTIYPFGLPTLTPGNITLEPATSTYITKTAVNTWVQSTQTNVSIEFTSFTGTLTGMTTTITGTILAFRIGGLVMLTVTGNVTGTSNATSMTMTGVPASLRPALGAKVVPSFGMQDNGAKIGGEASISTGGTITFGTGINGNTTGFTAASTKGLQAGWTMVYPL